jgi:hypothetical protein
MVVCYIYFTRIIVYLLRITVPFQVRGHRQLLPQIAVFWIRIRIDFDRSKRAKKDPQKKG